MIDYRDVQPYIDENLERIIEFSIRSANIYESALAITEDLDTALNFADFRNHHIQYVSLLKNKVAKTGTPSSIKRSLNLQVRFKDSFRNNDKEILKLVIDRKNWISKSYMDAVWNIGKKKHLTDIVTKGVKENQRHDFWIQSKLTDMETTPIEIR